MTVWDVFWFLFVFLPLTILWVLVLTDMLRRRDLVGWQKGLWAMGIIFLPWLGSLMYLITRPRDAAVAQYAGGAEPRPASQAAVPQAPARQAPTPEVPTDATPAT